MSTTTDKAIPTWGEAKTLGVGDWQLIAKSNRFENNTFDVVELNSIRFNITPVIIQTLLYKSSFEYSIDFWGANSGLNTAQCQTYNIVSGLYTKAPNLRTPVSNIQITNITPLVGDSIGIVYITIGIDENDNAIFELSGNTLMPPTIEYKHSYVFMHVKY